MVSEIWTFYRMCLKIRVVLCLLANCKEFIRILVTPKTHGAPKFLKNAKQSTNRIRSSFKEKSFCIHSDSVFQERVIQLYLWIIMRFGFCIYLWIMFYICRPWVGCSWILNQFIDRALRIMKGLWISVVIGVGINDTKHVRLFWH